MRKSFGERMDLLDAVRPNRGADVVDLVPELRLRALDARDRWTLSADDLDRITADLWPGVHGPAPEISAVKGKAPTTPPLTDEGRLALDRIGEQVSSITSELSSLTERALKGLAFEAHRMSTFEDETLWRAVVDEAKRFQAIRAAHRTGRGEWYAVLEVMRDDPDDPVVRHHVVTEEVKCSSRKEAIAA